MTAQRPADAPVITLIAAVARNGTIGADGGMPWHLPADLKRFKTLTMGHDMIMGRRTFESIGRALPGRRTIVVTRDRSWQRPDVLVAHSVQEALAMTADSRTDREVMVVGGGEIYRQTIDRADRLEITHVELDVAGDTTFPDIDPQCWQPDIQEQGDGFRCVTYRRRAPSSEAQAGAEAGAEPAVRDLNVLLRSMRPHLHPGEYAFCAAPADAMPPGLHPVATVTEDEGMTLVLPLAEALAAGLDVAFRCARITLQVTSALDAVGLTAAVATALANDGIACNVLAGAHHDHLFVPSASADAAMAALAALAHIRR